MGESVLELVKQIDSTRSQVSVNSKDETRVMMAMLNDKTYKVDIYGKTGIEGQFCPYEESRSMVASIIKDTTKISNREAIDLANNYEFGKQESNVMIGLAKEFINTYMETGRKLSLGGRANSDISISKKIKEAKVGGTPKKVGVSDDGKDIYECVPDTEETPSHGSLKIYSPCPVWLKEKK